MNKTQINNMVRHSKFILFGGFLTFFTFFFDELIFKTLNTIRLPQIEDLMLFITDFGLLYILLLILIAFFLYKKYEIMTLLTISVIASFEIGFLLKIFFQTPRPYFSFDVALTPLITASGYSFPSLHSTVCFAIIPFITKLFKRKITQIFIIISLISIALSRTYLGVHYLSDVTLGAIIGFTTSLTFTELQQKHNFLDWIWHNTKDKIELRRQLAHIFIGTTILFLLKLKLLNSATFLIILTLGLLISIISKYFKLPIISAILKLFDRPKDLLYFPGKGSFFLVLGAFLSTLFFDESIALAAIAIMTIGDALTSIIGLFFSKIKNPFSSHKHLESTLIATFFSILAAMIFVDFPLALTGSIFGMAIEAVYPPKWNVWLDDNLLVPLFAGIAMTLLS